MKAYIIVFEWSTECASGNEVEVYGTYQKALNRFYQIINDEQNPEISWVGDAWDENGNLLENYELQCNEQYDDKEEHDHWWYVECKNNYYLHDHLELRILEVM